MDLFLKIASSTTIFDIKKMHWEEVDNNIVLSIKQSNRRERIKTNIVFIKIIKQTFSDKIVNYRFLTTISKEENETTLTTTRKHHDKLAQRQNWQQHCHEDRKQQIHQEQLRQQHWDKHGTTKWSRKCINKSELYIDNFSTKWNTPPSLVMVVNMARATSSTGTFGKGTTCPTLLTNIERERRQRWKQLD